MKPIINADDFAQNAAIDDAILALADKQIIASTSVMTLSPYWKQSAKKLEHTKLSVGLHFDLTSEFTQAFGINQKLSDWILKSYLRPNKIAISQIQESLYMQWQRFCDAYGKIPDFMDGHQHIHQLPVIRDVIFEFLTQQPLPKSFWVRSCQSQQWRGLKAHVISALGATRFTIMAQQHNILYNSDFLGVYDFSHTDALPKLWQSWLTSAQGSRPLIMCHIAKPSQHTDHDPIKAAREAEFKWLSSQAFNDLYGK